MIAVDRLVNLTAQAVYAVGDWSRSIQTGRLRNYLMFLAAGLVGLFVGVLAWIRVRNRCTAALADPTSGPYSLKQIRTELVTAP